MLVTFSGAMPLISLKAGMNCHTEPVRLDPQLVEIGGGLPKTTEPCQCVTAEDLPLCLENEGAEMNM